MLAGPRSAGPRFFKQSHCVAAVTSAAAITKTKLGESIDLELALEALNSLSRQEALTERTEGSQQRLPAPISKISALSEPKMLERFSARLTGILQWHSERTISESIKQKTQRAAKMSAVHLSGRKAIQNFFQRYDEALMQMRVFAQIKLSDYSEFVKMATKGRLQLGVNTPLNSWEVELYTIDLFLKETVSPALEAALRTEDLNGLEIFGKARNALLARRREIKKNHPKMRPIEEVAKLMPKSATDSNSKGRSTNHYSLSLAFKEAFWGRIQPNAPSFNNILTGKVSDSAQAYGDRRLSEVLTPYQIAFDQQQSTGILKKTARSALDLLYGGAGLASLGVQAFTGIPLDTILAAPVAEISTTIVGPTALSYFGLVARRPIPKLKQYLTEWKNSSHRIEDGLEEIRAINAQHNLNRPSWVAIGENMTFFQKTLDSLKGRSNYSLVPNYEDLAQKNPEVLLNENRNSNLADRYQNEKIDTRVDIVYRRNPGEEPTLSIIFRSEEVEPVE